MTRAPAEPQPQDDAMPATPTQPTSPAAFDELRELFAEAARELARQEEAAGPDEPEARKAARLTAAWERLAVDATKMLGEVPPPSAAAEAPSETNAYPKEKPMPANAILCPDVVQERMDELIALAAEPGNERASELLVLYSMLFHHTAELRDRWHEAARLAARALLLLERGDPMGYLTCSPIASEIDRVGERVTTLRDLIVIAETAES